MDTPIKWLENEINVNCSRIECTLNILFFLEIILSLIRIKIVNNIIASPIASLVRLPLHSSIIVSQSNPSVTNTFNL